MEIFVQEETFVLLEVMFFVKVVVHVGVVTLF